MSNRLFQGIIHQMKDAIDRTIGVVDASGTIICCSDLRRIGESAQVDIREDGAQHAGGLLQVRGVRRQ